ncbi:MAG: hypothetical protein AAGA30_17050, partial [Planctomycetota bacterium]
EDLANQATETAKDLENKFPLLSACEQVNVQIAEKIGKLEEEAAKTLEFDGQLRQQYIDIRRKFDETRNKISFIGQSNTVGARLRKRKSELPSSVQQQQQAEFARQRIGEIEFEQFQVTEQLAELSTETIYSEIREDGAEVTESDLKRLDEPIKNLIERRRESLRTLNKIYDRLFGYYFDIETDNSRLAKLVEEFNEYINERILWRKSNNLLFTEWEFDKADTALTSPEKYREFGSHIRNVINKQPTWVGLWALLFLVLLSIRGMLRRKVDALGEIAARGSCVTFWPTGKATIFTTLIAITIPMLVYSLGWLLSRIAPSGSDLFDATGYSLQLAGLFAVPFELLRRVCRPNGLARRHFDWSNTAVEILKQNLTWFVFPASVLVYGISLLIRIDSAHRIDLPERILFLIAMALTFCLLSRIFSPTRGIFRQYLQSNENSWAKQTSSIWFALVLLVPISLATLTITGYYYTSINLTRCLCYTFGIAVGIELVRALVRRFVLIRRRSAHIESARRKREAESEAQREAMKKEAAERQRRLDAGEDVKELTTQVMTSESMADLQFENIDVDQNAGQANQLIRLLGWAGWLLGLWIVWSDVLPALQALDEYKLWPASTVATAATSSNSEVASESVSNNTPSDPTADSSSSESSEIPSQPSTTASPSYLNESKRIDDSVSLRDFLVFLAIVLLTFFAAKNLPNAFEMLFLEDLPVDRSARFASKALFSYAIIIAGTMLAMRTLATDASSKTLAS